MIDTLKPDYPIRFLCEIMDCSPSSYYYRPIAKSEDKALLEAIEFLLAERPYLGYRMVRARLKQRGIVAGERAIRRILSQMGRTRSVGRVIKTTDSNHSHPRYPNLIRNIDPDYPDQIWVGDITYIRYGHQFVYLAVILDAFTRAVRGWHLEEFLTSSELTEPALKMALTHNSPAYFHSDQGKQYAATSHVNLLKKHHTLISMSDAGCPTQNGIVERFMRTLKEEHVAYSEYDSFRSMRQQIKLFLEIEYNQNRPHSSLDYLTPAEFEAKYHLQKESLGVHSA